MDCFCGMGNLDSLGIPDDLGSRVEDWSMVKEKLLGFSGLLGHGTRLPVLLVHTAEMSSLMYVVTPSIVHLSIANALYT